MIKFINKLTGTAMWVSDERKNEYEAAGHKLAASSSSHSSPNSVKKAAKTQKRGK